MVYRNFRKISNQELLFDKSFEMLASTNKIMYKKQTWKWESALQFLGGALDVQPNDSWSVLPKMHFLDILEIFRLDISQSSFNLVSETYATRQLAFLSTSFWRRKRPTP